MTSIGAVEFNGKFRAKMGAGKFADADGAIVRGRLFIGAENIEIRKRLTVVGGFLYVFLGWLALGTIFNFAVAAAANLFRFEQTKGLIALATLLGLGCAIAVTTMAARGARRFHAQFGIAQIELASVGNKSIELQLQPGAAAFDRLSFAATVPREMQRLVGLLQKAGVTIDDPGARESAEFLDRLILATPRTWVTQLLLAVNALVFMAMLYRDRTALFAPKNELLIRWGANLGVLTLSTDWWRLLSSCFVHVGIIHFGLNMLVLFFIGPLAERIFGNGLYLAVYLLAGLSGSLSSALWNSEITAAGASGAIFGIYGALGAFLLRERINIPKTVFERLGRSTAAFVVCNLCFGAYNLFSSPGSVRIDMGAHVGGLISGFIYGFAAARPLDLPARQHVAGRAASILFTAAAALLLILGFAAHASAFRSAHGYYALGALHYSGIGVQKNAPRAVEWFRKAAQGDDVRAQFTLATIYLRGEGVPTNSAEGIHWLTRAAQNDHAEAIWDLATIYLHGNGVKADPAEALKWYLKLAEQGHTGAELQVARLYLEGGAIPQDNAKSFHWFLKAAEHGAASAYTIVGTMYLEGDGVAKDPALAATWLRKAADHNEAFAQRLLGYLYYFGEGVPKDHLESYKWLSRAESRQSDSKAHDMLQALEKELPPSDVEKFRAPSKPRPAPNASNSNRVSPK